MSKYRANVVERVAAAKHIQAKVTGVHQEQTRHSLPDSNVFIAANPDRYERLPDYGNMFPFDPFMEVGHVR